MQCGKRHKGNFKVTKINAHLGSVPVMATSEDKFKTSGDNISFFMAALYQNVSTDSMKTK